MATVIPQLNGLQVAAWLRTAITCPHCQQRPTVRTRYDINTDSECMVIGCGGKTDRCIRFPIQSMDRSWRNMENIYKSRKIMADMLVVLWNEHHIESTERLEGHA